MPIRIDWYPAAGDLGPVFVGTQETPGARVTSAGAFDGAICFDFWVTRTDNYPQGTETSHMGAPNLVWDWATSHPGALATHELSSPLDLTWPKCDNSGRPVQPGPYFAYLNIRSPGGGFYVGAHASFVIDSLESGPSCPVRPPQATVTTVPVFTTEPPRHRGPNPSSDPRTREVAHVLARMGIGIEPIHHPDGNAATQGRAGGTALRLFPGSMTWLEFPAILTDDFGPRPVSVDVWVIELLSPPSRTSEPAYSSMPDFLVVSHVIADAQTAEPLCVVQGWRSSWHPPGVEPVCAALGYRVDKTAATAIAAALMTESRVYSVFPAIFTDPHDPNESPNDAWIVIGLRFVDESGSDTYACALTHAEFSYVVVSAHSAEVIRAFVGRGRGWQLAQNANLSPASLAEPE